MTGTGAAKSRKATNLDAKWRIIVAEGSAEDQANASSYFL